MLSVAEVVVIFDAAGAVVGGGVVVLVTGPLPQMTMVGSFVTL